MRYSGVLDETDLAIIRAVEKAPRAPWAMLAGLIGVDPGTAARRWQRIEESGMAWVTCYPLLAHNQVSAIIEITCTAGTSTRIALDLAHDPQAIMVELIAGKSDILLTVLSDSRRSLFDYLTGRIETLEGVISVHPHPIINLHSDGGYSANDTSGDRKQTQLPSVDGRLVLGSGRENDDLDWQICQALSENGRIAFSELSTVTGISEASVRRRITRLTEQGALRMIVEVAADVASTSTVVWYRLRIPAKDLAGAAKGISALNNVRAVLSVAGPDNLIVKAAFPRLSNLNAFDAHLNGNYPTAEIRDRNVVLRATRQVGRLVDELGFVTAMAPVDIRTRLVAVQ